MLILIDTREQRPYEFADIKSTESFAMKEATLPSGDYLARRGFDSPPAESVPAAVQACAVVERKSLADLYGSLGSSRDRFQREIKRLATYGYAALVIEAGWEGIFNPNQWLRHPTKLSPKSALASLIAWSQRFNIHVFTCPGRPAAELITFRILERWIRDEDTEAPVKTKRFF